MEDLGRMVKYFIIFGLIGILPTIYVLFKIILWIVNHVRIIII